MEFDDEEFIIDTGISLDEEDGELKFNSTSDNEIDADKVEVRDPKRVALITIVIGIVIMMITLALFSVSNQSKNKEAVNQNNDTLNSTVQDNRYNEEEKENGLDKNSDSKVSIEEMNGWIQFGTAGDISFDEVVTSEFTVINIQHFAKVANKNNDKMVKSVVKGNISGLVGTYEVEIPYYKAVKLTEGTVLRIEYKYGTQNGAKVIGELIFI